MMVVRPAALEDLGSLQRLAVEAGKGMTNLPSDRELLEEKIHTSLASFAKDVAVPGSESYFLVMEDTGNGRIVGCCAVMASVGLTRPVYNFRVIRLTHSSQELEKYEPVEALQMVEDYRGTTEIGTLYLTPEYRRGGNGKLLSRCRFVLLANFPERFASLVFAEMRGVLDERGYSVFWDNLGRHFLHMEYSKADYLSSLGKYQFIADLMPKYPVYIRLLPRAAQEVIGVTHEATRPALEILQREGFRYEGCVDVFDAGPAVHCPLDQIRTVKDSRRATVAVAVEAPAGIDCVVSNSSLEGLRVGRASVRELEHGVQISVESAKLLGVAPGEEVRYVEF